jgi:hypothetical protein
MVSLVEVLAEFRAIQQSVTNATETISGFYAADADGVMATITRKVSLPPQRYYSMTRR